MRASLLLVFCFFATGCDSCSSKSGPTPAPTFSGPLVSHDAGPPVNATPLPSAAVAALVNPRKLPAYVGPTGSIEGTITITGPAAKATPAERQLCTDASGAKIYDKEFREGEPSTPNGSRWLADALIAVTGYSDFYIQEKEEAELLPIEGCAYKARTVTMTFGQRLEVKNATKDFWTPMLLPQNQGVMMMAPPNATEGVKIYPKKPGRFLLVDHDRKWAEADVFVLMHPLHGVSAVGGKYRIEGVPVGKVKVNAMHPKLGSNDASSEVEVRTDVIANVDLTIVNAPPPAPVDAGSPAKQGDGGRYPNLH